MNTEHGPVQLTAPWKFRSVELVTFKREGSDFYECDLEIKSATFEAKHHAFGRQRERAMAFALRALADDLLAQCPPFPEDPPDESQRAP